MAIKKPLVLDVDGRPQQLQAGDTLAAGTDSQISQTAVATLIAGNAVYVSANDAVSKGVASAKPTSKLLGLAASAISATAAGFIQYGDIVTLTTGQWDAVAGTTGGLTAGTDYYLSPATAGLLTATCPTTAGQCVVIIGKAISTTELRLVISEPILL